MIKEIFKRCKYNIYSMVVCLLCIPVVFVYKPETLMVPRIIICVCMAMLNLKCIVSVILSLIREKRKEKENV